MSQIPPEFPPPSSASRRWAFFVAGAVAVAVAIAVGEILAGLIAGAPSLVVAVGSLVIDLQPPGAKDLVVTLFGTNDKLALNVAILVVALTVGGLLGLVARASFARAAGGSAVFGLVALFASLRLGTFVAELSVITVAIALGSALLILRLLIDEAVGHGTDGRRTGPVTSDAPTVDRSRRRFLILSGSLAVGSVAVGYLGRALLQTAHSQAPEASLPATGLSPAPLAPDTSLPVDGITPIVVPNNDFYRIDTALVVPRVNVATWSMTVTGMVDRAVTLTYGQLAAMPIFEQYVTIACVSNEVGGDLVGNALWRGAHLRDVLALAGVQPGATQIVGRSVDGFTVGFPTEWAMDPSRDPMIALGMNGEPLPVEHGYPARLIVPGLYGYVSATKWLAELQLTTLEKFDAYWVPRGWAKEAPILTQSRIDVPRPGAGLGAGTVVVAGVAWAPDRGVSGVEVRVDDGAWQPATLSAAISRATWVQWRLGWDATPGDHTLAVRATDGTGAVQTDRVTPPPPDGARGYHTIQVHVA
jgi:DMSO/TMAO reductase YedYZ molybdopterin-dependent catalytic subunit